MEKQKRRVQPADLQNGAEKGIQARPCFPVQRKSKQSKSALFPEEEPGPRIEVPGELLLPSGVTYHQGHFTPGEVSPGFSFYSAVPGGSAGRG